MASLPRALLLTVCLSLTSVTVTAAPAAPAPNDDNCRNAIHAALEMLRQVQPGGRLRDEDDRKRLLAEMERLVDDSRRQGISECQTWAQFMRKAAKQ